MLEGLHAALLYGEPGESRRIEVLPAKKLGGHADQLWVIGIGLEEEADDELLGWELVS